MATAASLGTTLTLIGAPAFLFANNILTRHGEDTLGLFSVGHVDVPLTIAGILFCVLMRWVLPKTSGVDDTADKFSFGDDNHISLSGEEKRILKAVISTRSAFIGRSV